MNIVEVSPHHAINLILYLYDKRKDLENANWC